MNIDILVSMGIGLIMSAIRLFVKNPQSKETVREELLIAADQIYLAYGITPPQHN